ncbi:hypothetical protein PCANC_07885 [Puccinia coronata f. sp. avenae]|uniref:Uncharacterized protein n=1 Tax=Puccinia coronata f. sp. avenae TaxID=200324 RepID=A0A2N5UNE1_9BASI|nr:hypothetical protein PCANC_19161 [Puccinia coronata f. sp. avenae]PLW39166.1 hypothetical protein PCASD_07640 [Puccinia coronata f. sp. avenae]PLW47861.1 hypothetical protein PCANC_07885 [Puccinia coronata f. sp. avenae]
MLFGGFASVRNKELVKNPPDTRLRGRICRIRMSDVLYPTPTRLILSLSRMERPGDPPGGPPSERGAHRAARQYCRPGPLK